MKLSLESLTTLLRFPGDAPGTGIVGPGDNLVLACSGGPKIVSPRPCVSGDRRARACGRFGVGDSSRSSSSSPFTVTSPSKTSVVRRGLGVPLRLGVPALLPPRRGESSPVLRGTTVVVGSPRKDWLGDPGESDILSSTTSRNPFLRVDSRLGVPGRLPPRRGVSSPVLIGMLVVFGSPRND